MCPCIPGRKEFGSVGFWGEGKNKEPQKILLEQGREPKTNPTLIWCWCRDLTWPHGESGVLYSKCSNQRIMPLFYLHTAHLVIFFLGEGRGCLCEKKRTSKLVFWASSPHILLSQGHFSLALVNDLHVVRQWFAWILAHWRMMLVCVSRVNRGDNHWQVKFNELITKSKVPYHPCFVFLHKFCQNSKLTQN